MKRMGRAGLAVGILLIAVVVVVIVVAVGGDDADDVAAASTVLQTSTQPTDGGGGSLPATTAAPSSTASGEVVVTNGPAPTTTTTIVDRPRTTAEATPEDPVPPGEVIEFTGVWDMAVTAVDFDAADYVTGLNDINPEPEPGFQYVLVDLVGIYLGDRSAEPVFEWTISSATNTYGPSIPGCGVLPASLYDIVEVVPGESFQGSICAPVLTEDVAAGLELTLKLVGDDPKFFTLE